MASQRTHPTIPSPPHPTPLTSRSPRRDSGAKAGRGVMERIRMARQSWPCAALHQGVQWATVRVCVSVCLCTDEKQKWD